MLIIGMNDHEYEIITFSPSCHILQTMCIRANGQSMDMKYTYMWRTYLTFVELLKKLTK